MPPRVEPTARGRNASWTRARSASSMSPARSSIEPDTLDTASDVKLERAALDALGRRGAEGYGLAPDAHLPADVRDRRLRRGARADRALRRQDVRRAALLRARRGVDGPEDAPAGAQPATYVRAPC